VRREDVDRMGTFADKLRSLVGGETRDGAEDELKRAYQKLREKNRKLKKLREKVAERDQELAELRARLAGGVGAVPSSIKPENVVWIFGAGRSGTTWLASMFGELPSWGVWFEPRVGALFDPANRPALAGRHYVLAPEHEVAWLPAARLLVLAGAASRCPRSNYVLIKDPGGSAGASVMMKALPESRVALLIRDPRDVVASWLDASDEGGWRRARKGAEMGTPLEAAARHARGYLKQVSGAKLAYDAHGGPKVLLRYEELRADTLTEMRRALDELGISIPEEDVRRAVEVHAWESISEEEKGKGKFYRKASPGSWREDLTPEQIEVVESITAPLLEEFYPG